MSFELTPYRRRGSHYPADVFSTFFGNDFLNRFFSDGFFAAKSSINLDIRDDKDKYVVEAEIPGVQKEQISIDVKDGMLTISANENKEENIEKENYIYRERKSGRISRCLTLDNIKEDEIKASYKDGVLKIELPKMDPQKSVKRNIEIQ